LNIYNAEKEKQKRFWKEIRLANRFDFRKETRYSLISETSTKFVKKKEKKREKEKYVRYVTLADID